jgi:FMN phosphatase YigB (HAD superfamily)
MPKVTFPLDEIKYVLLDMDGTLLDKYFDDYFWEHLLPEKYAEKERISFGRAKEELLAKYHARPQGTDTAPYRGPSACGGFS